MTWTDYYKTLLSLVLWREAEGEGRTGMLAVACVIRNRVNAANLPDQWDDVIARRWQFSSMTAPGDPTLTKWPLTGDAAFETAMQVAEQVYSGDAADITNGATHYFNPSVVLPSWAAGMTKVASIGHHDFYKEAATA